MKKITVSKAKKKTWTFFSIFIRTRDCIDTTGCPSFGLCITCGRRYHFKLLQAGHFLPGRHNANLFYEKGCHAQCYNCNINLKGNTMAYVDALHSKYGQGIVKELRENDRRIKKFTVLELQEMEKDFKNRTKKFVEKNNGS